MRERRGKGKEEGKRKVRMRHSGKTPPSSTFSRERGRLLKETKKGGGKEASAKDGPYVQS